MKTKILKLIGGGKSHWFPLPRKSKISDGPGFLGLKSRSSFLFLRRDFVVDDDIQISTRPHRSEEVFRG